MMVKAPGVVKLLGEHAVVYGKLSVAAALDMYSQVKSENAGKDMLEITDLGVTERFSKPALDALYARYGQRSSIVDYIEQSRGISDIMLPYATIAARIMHLPGADVLGRRVEISSGIPMRSGFASSASCFTAFATAMLKNGGKATDDGTIIDIARDGDRIVHRNENAGGIDVSTSYFGGYVSFSKTGGPKREDVGTNLDMLLVDTGPKKSTAETVGHVAELYKSDKAETEKILDEINDCAVKGLEMLKNRDLKGFGALMFKDHELLRKLGVSSNGLDKAVDVAKRAGAYGAKLSGGGGGGLAIAIGGDLTKISGVLETEGFKVSRSSVALSGASAA